MRMKIDARARAVGIFGVRRPDADPVKAAPKIKRLRPGNYRAEYMETAFPDVRRRHVDHHDLQPGASDALDGAHDAIEHVVRTARVCRDRNLPRRGEREFEGGPVFRQERPQHMLLDLRDVLERGVRQVRAFVQPYRAARRARGSTDPA